MNIKIFSLLNKKKKFELKLIFFLSSIYFFLEFASLSSIPVFVGILINPELILKKVENLTNLEIIGTYSNSDYQMFFAALVIFLFIIKNLYLVLITICESSFLQRFKISISNKLFNFYAKLPYSYHLKNNPVKLTRMVSDEIQNISGYIQHLLTFIREILALIVIFILLLIANRPLAIFMFLLFISVSLIYFKIIKPFVKEAAKKNQLIRKSMFQTINEAFGIIKEIKIYSKEDQVVAFFDKNNEKFEKNLYYFYIINKLPRVILETFALMLIILVSLFFFNSSGGDYSKHFPILALLTVATVRFIPAFNGIVTSLTYIKMFGVSVKLISDEIIDMENFKNENLHKKKIVTKLDDQGGNYLQIQNLSFKYPMKEKYLLNQINFSVNKGSKLAITGETGSGKSTLMQLVLGLFVPQDGDILFRNKSIFQNLKNWRNEIGYIPQQVYLLDSTIEKNITLNFFDEKIDKAKMEKAIFLSGLSKKITDLPNGLETRTGSDGLKLSGGEKQRIVIARAIYREPNILIMDEFTSSLDQDTENRILLNLSEFLKDKTIIIISHRSNSIKNCDTILNIENGKLIEIKK